MIIRGFDDQGPDVEPGWPSMVAMIT